MSLFEIYNTFIENAKVTSWQEWVSTFMQIASVWFASKNKVWVYPTGIIGVILAAYAYYFIAEPPLYADALLNVYYFAMSIYGWYNWLRKDNGAVHYPIAWCSNKERINGVLVFMAAWITVWGILKKLTNSNTPVLDAIVSASALTAMWWMAKRKIENWHAWIVSNILAIPLNYYKGFMLFTAMYILFLGMALYGLYAWKKQLKSKPYDDVLPSH